MTQTTLYKTLVQIRRRIERDGEKPAIETIAAGTEVDDLAPGHAEVLLANGSIVAVGGAVSEPPTSQLGDPPGETLLTEPAPAGKRPGKKGDRIAAIEEQIGALDTDNPGHFTEDGKPHVQALEALLGWRPSAEERDAAWVTFQDWSKH